MRIPRGAGARQAPVVAGADHQRRKHWYRLTIQLPEAGKGLANPPQRTRIFDEGTNIPRSARLAAMVQAHEPAPREIVEIAQEAVIAFPDWSAAVAAIGLTGDPAADMARAM